MTLQQFLVFMHDKMIPKWFRNIIDSVYINVPVDYIVAAAQKLIQKSHIERLSSDFNLIGSDTNPINPDGENKSINVKKVGPNYVDLNQEYTDQSFVLSFIQNKDKLKSKLTSKFTHAIYSNDYLQ